MNVTENWGTLSHEERLKAAVQVGNIQLGIPVRATESRTSG